MMHKMFNKEESDRMVIARKEVKAVIYKHYPIIDDDNLNEVFTIHIRCVISYFCMLLYNGVDIDLEKTTNDMAKSIVEAVLEIMKDHKPGNGSIN